MVNTILIATVVVLVVIVIMLVMTVGQLAKELLQFQLSVLQHMLEEADAVEGEFLKLEETTQDYDPFEGEFVSPPHTGKTNCPCWECEEARIEGPICTENEGCGCNDCSYQRKLEKFYAEGECTNNIHCCECLECKDKRMFAGLDMVE